ncbi:hemolysin family protein [Enteractinococcus fodinae]|uniref:CBS domain containing-hemolysin-like protein n=1 Tax=Enteractinococcus fodinae TaxID=684663 RepID=A0ABU2AXJ7_9MICC|nr:hemolysin family protein [Enteractinococcus fodinae]MDR7346071.1 CBS domain containing-hemolysin-like protein [Enteractinococcus fodinae]
MLTPVLMLLLGILVILAIIAANGYFVAQEFAYMSVDRAQLAAEAEEGDEAAAQALKVTRRTSFMLSGAQLGITVTGLMVGYVAEPLVGQSLGALLGGVGVPAGVSVTIGTVLALAVSTIVQMVFGELYPKNLAIANPGPLSRALAKSTNIYLGIFGWLISFFDWSANRLLRLVGIKPVEDPDSSATAADLKRIVADSRHSGHLGDDLSIMIDRILDYPHRDVEHAMIPLTNTDSISPEATIGEVRELMASAHTRYPVLDSDNVPLGVVHLLDVLAAADRPEAPVTAIMREPVTVPPVMMLPQAQQRMTNASSKIACVVDEYGGLVGILTLEDLAEEVTGDVVDEHDPDFVEPIETQGSNAWRISGTTPVDEVERQIKHALPRGEYETLSGMLIDHLQDLPKLGEVIRIELPQLPSDLVGDEPVSRCLQAKVVELEKRVPSMVEVDIEVTVGSSDPKEEAAQ